MLMPGRKFAAGSGYRYGFNGKENDNSTGEGNLDFGARIMDVRLGRWLSVDPLQKKYPSFSPFNYAINNPLVNIDVDGRDIIDFILEILNKKYSNLAGKWNKVDAFRNCLGQFANIHSNDDSKTLGYTASGDFKDVKLAFKQVTDKEDFVLRTQIQVKGENGKWTNLVDLATGEKYKGGLDNKAKGDFRIIIEANTNTGGLGENLIAGGHDLIIHAQKFGEMVNKIGAEGYSGSQVLGDYYNSLMSNQQHLESSQGKNSEYEKFNNELEAVVKTDYGNGVTNEKFGVDIRKGQGTFGIEGKTENANKTGSRTVVQAVQNARAIEKSYINQEYEKGKARKQ